MPRKPDPTLKPAILEKVTEHLLDTKLEDVSVRSLGRVLGTSAYPIVYHFGTREALIQAVVDHLAETVTAADLDPASDHAALADWLVTTFGGLDHPERALAARLTFELGSVEALDGHRHQHAAHRGRVETITAWVVAHGTPPDDAELLAQDAVLAARGAQWGFLVDPEHTDVDAALRAVADDLAASTGAVRA
ncbi:TetR/AcrR family transcriptional regulator [Curtobacterium sp. MCLR17_036]|uniref:TetR/AcrR family transcriptional regulator n=1 Tax=Curtobacterium sp. MCLR17_036 TaxID=2175620 RepID=UPI000DA8088A|nr:TetR/AcrR family transcriptional regulator [Curtobacterium sp. MCLR17_036]WIE63990.1 TetR/AcrR family transcriptional regulator [Curtobacterium sp. MCLR17_036]